MCVLGSRVITDTWLQFYNRLIKLFYLWRSTTKMIDLYSPCHTKRRWHSVCTAFWKHRREARLKIPNLTVIACTRRSYSVPLAFPQRLDRVHDASTAHKKLLQDVHGAHTMRTQREYSVFTAIIVLRFYFTFLYFEQPCFCEHSYLFWFFEAIRQNNYQLLICLRHVGPAKSKYRIYMASVKRAPSAPTTRRGRSRRPTVFP